MRQVLVIALIVTSFSGTFSEALCAEGPSKSSKEISPGRGGGGDANLVNILSNSNNMTFVRSNFSENAANLFSKRLKQVTWDALEVEVPTGKERLFVIYNGASPKVALNIKALTSLPADIQSSNLLWCTLLATLKDESVRKSAYDLDDMLRKSGVSLGVIHSQRMLFIKSDLLPKVKREEDSASTSTKTYSSSNEESNNNSSAAR